MQEQLRKDERLVLARQKLRLLYHNIVEAAGPRSGIHFQSTRERGSRVLHSKHIQSIRVLLSHALGIRKNGCQDQMVPLHATRLRRLAGLCRSYQGQRKTVLRSGLTHIWPMSFESTTTRSDRGMYVCRTTQIPLLSLILSSSGKNRTSQGHVSSSSIASSWVRIPACCPCASTQAS